MRYKLVYWAHYQRDTPYGEKWLRSNAQSRLYLNINILLSEKHTLNISPVKVRAQKNAKTKLYIFMYKLDNNTYQRGWEKGRRWVKMKIVFTR